MMTKALIPISFAALLVSASCAVRMGATPAETTPTAVPRGEVPKAPNLQDGPDEPVVATGSSESPAVPDPGTPQPSGEWAPTAASEAAESQAPAATASVYVFSAQQAVSALSSGSSTTGLAPSPDAPPGELQLSVVASASEIAAGGIMTVDVMASSNTAVVDAPLHLTFDPSVVEFVDGATGDFLTQGGSNVVFFADGRRPGVVAIAAGRVERENGARGAGLLCRVTFRGIGSGTTPVLVGQAKAWGTRGEELTVLGAGTNVAVN